MDSPSYNELLFFFAIFSTDFVSQIILYLARLPIISRNGLINLLRKCHQYVKYLIFVFSAEVLDKTEYYYQFIDCFETR
jgi:hypothetical protein